MAQYSQRYDSASFPYSSAPSAPPFPAQHDSLLTATAPPFPSSYHTSGIAPPFPSAFASTPSVNAGVPSYPLSSVVLPPAGYPYVPPPPATYGCGSPASIPPFFQGDVQGGGVPFPPGTPLEIAQSFHAVDTDQSGVLDERELQAALSSGYQQFSIRTVRLLLFIFNNRQCASGIGPAEFAVLWDCIRQWRAVFKNFDKDRSGKIHSTELRNALRSLGYVVPPSVIEVIVTRYSDGNGGRKTLSFDNFVECAAIVKGLTEKFKERDTRFIGSASLTYDAFMTMVVPFIVP